MYIEIGKSLGSHVVHAIIVVMMITTIVDDTVVSIFGFTRSVRLTTNLQGGNLLS